jgi:diazepam-binding inhibitor (GABA receptor modulating acyl-CoA-binding protein)
MTDDFEAAVAAVPSLTRDPGTQVKLALYALYKQATEGDVHGKRPGFADFVGKSKYDAWARLRGISPEEARADYVAKVAELQEAERG